MRGASPLVALLALAPALAGCTGAADLDLAPAGDDGDPRGAPLDAMPAYWEPTLAWLAARDADRAPRPLVATWVDPARWLDARSEHGAATGLFDDGRRFAAKLLLAESEAHAMQVLAGALLSRVDDAQARALLAERGLAPDALEALRAFEPVASLDLAASLDLLLASERASGHAIRYVLVEPRMVPMDDPRTPFVESHGIFWAIAKHAGAPMEDYVETLAHGPEGEPPTEERLVVREKLTRTLLWRAGGGLPPAPDDPAFGLRLAAGYFLLSPAGGLQHFRAVRVDEVGVLLELTPGARVAGTLSQNGVPLAGERVLVRDDAASARAPPPPPHETERYDAPHASTTTDAEGRFELVVPFSMERPLRIVAERDGVELARAELHVAREDAEARRAFDVALHVPLQRVHGRLFLEEHGWQVAPEGVPGVRVELGALATTTDAQGAFAFEGVPPGAHALRVADERYSDPWAPREVRVTGGEDARVDVLLAHEPVRVRGVLVDAASGAPLASTFFVAVGRGGEGTWEATTDAEGRFEVALDPGAYDVLVPQPGADRTGELSVPRHVAATTATVAVRDGADVNR